MVNRPRCPLTDPVENRAAVRIAWQFWVGLEGVDARPRLRRGNLSVSGAYFEVARSVGEIGTIHWMQLAARESVPPVAVMGRLARVVTVDDIDSGGLRTGVAFEFLHENRATKRAVRQLVRELATLQLEADDRRMGLPPTAETALPRQPPAHPARTRRVHIECRWRFEPGEPVRFELASPDGEPKILDGKVVHSAEVAGRPRWFRTELSASAAGSTAASSGRPRRQSVHDVFDLLFRESTGAARRDGLARRDRLLGTLAQVRLPSLLSFFELERLSGHLRIARGGETAKLYIDSGRLVDATISPRPQAPRFALAHALDWPDGRFEFIEGAVNREDQFGKSTNALLLEITVAKDEGSSPAGW